MIKKVLGGLCAGMLIGVAIVAAPAIAGQFGDYGGGYSTNITATAVSIGFGGDTMKDVSLFSNGSNTQLVYMLPDCTPVILATAVSNQTAIPLRGGLGYTFKDRPMTNICLQASSGTITVDIAARRK